jgi:predicted ATPase
VGGSGKTRLAIQAAAESIADFANGVWLIELAAIGDQDLIAATIAETLGLKAGAGSQSGSDSASTLEQVAGHLKGRAVLLILDNCEHLIGATAQVVYYLLQHCPGVTVLATSREGLGVPGEALWQVPSLHAAVDGDPMTSEAVRLFVERAQDANARFNADPASLTWVQRICERLDGMPLAIELAAARARVLDARQIADRLDDRFRLLTGGSRTALPRHQTLEATVDWSYDLMSRTERILFRRLAAFRGGFTLEAAEAVCAGDAVDMVDVLDLLAGLVDKSMVGRDEVSGRFKMLETLRQYALRRLSESDEVDDLRTRHAEYFRRFIEEQAPHLISAGEAEAIGAIALDHDNLRAALAFCLEHGREATAVHIASALSWYWWGFEPDEGLEWQRKVLPYIDLAEPGAAGTLLAFSALFAGTRRQPEAAALAEQAISRARSAGDHFAEGLGLLARGWISWQASHFDDAKKEGLAAAAIGAEYGYHWLVGQAELYAAFADRMMSRLDGAAEHLAAAEAAFRRQQSPSGLAWCLVLSGQVTRYRFDFDGEIRKQVEARKILAALGDHRSVATTFVNEGIALTLLERPQEAVASGRRGVALEREFGGGDPAEGLVLLGWFEHEANNHDEAFDLFEEALHLAEPALDPYAIDSIAEHLAHLLATLERHDDAARLDGFHQTNLPRPEPEIYAHHYERHRARYRQALGTRTESLLAEGAAMTPQQAHDLGLRAITELRRTR